MIKEAGFDSVDYNIDHFLSYSDISNGVIAPLYSQGDEAVYNALMEIGPNLVALHTHDNDGKNDQHLAPYIGVMDWDRFVKGLRDAGYRNALSFETFNAIQVVDRELAQPVLNYIAAAGKMFIKRTEA